jgi:hypothetical protein
MDTSSTFLFEVVFKDMPVLGESQAEPGSDRSIIVEVEPDRMVQKAFPHSVEDDRQFAKELALNSRCRSSRKIYSTALNPLIR